MQLLEVLLQHNLFAHDYTKCN